MGASKTDENEETPTASEKTSSTGYVQLDAGMKNMTKYDGDTLRIKCEITGYPLPRYQWFRNGVLLDAVTSHDGRINVRTTPWGSRLKITKLKVEDSGVYSCSGYNRFGRQTTSGDLSVRQGPNPNRGSGKSDRDPLDLDFDLDGDGFDTDVDLPFRIDPDLDDLDSDGEAEALPGEPSTTQDIARFRQSDDDYDDNDNDDEGGEEEEENVVGFCQSYRGATCSRFVGNKSIFVRNEYQQGLTEERLTTAFTLLATIPGGLSTSCGEFAIPAMCFDAFPLCDDRVKPPTQRPLCREDCQQLARGPCRREFLTVEASRAQDPKTNAGLPLPDCRHSSTSKGSCIRIGVPRLNERGNHSDRTPVSLR